MTHYNVELNEKISLVDSYEIEAEIDALIYRNEFEKYFKSYKKDGSETDLIFSYIFLQIYIECFLHQRMRKIIELEFKHTNEDIYKSWIKNDRRYIHQELDHFVKIFFSSVSDQIKEPIDFIKKVFKKISDIRNDFLHGHKIATWSNSNGASEITPARKVLTYDQISFYIKEVNKLGSLWNELLIKLSPKLKALTGLNDFRFSIFEFSWSSYFKNVLKLLI